MVPQASSRQWTGDGAEVSSETYVNLKTFALRRRFRPAASSQVVKLDRFREIDVGERAG